MKINKVNEIAMIAEDYVSFDTAKLLKEKGFDEKSTSYYQLNSFGEPVLLFDTKQFHNRQKNRYCRCTLQMTMKWLREVHRLHISVDVCPIYGKVKDEKGKNTCGLLYWNYMASGEWINDKYNPRQKAFVVSAKCYEEAVEAALKYCFENLI